MIRVLQKSVYICANRRKRYDNIATDNAAKYITRIEQDP